jgi:hypothetical protein
MVVEYSDEFFFYKATMKESFLFLVEETFDGRTQQASRPKPKVNSL